MGGKQLGFSDYEQTIAKMPTKREKFLADLDQVVPWAAMIDLIDLIEPHYPKTSSKGGRPPYPLATMLRIHLLQQWYSLSDPAMECARSLKMLSFCLAHAELLCLSKKGDTQLSSPKPPATRSS